MRNAVYHDPKAFQRPDAEQRHVPRFGEDHLVDGFKALRRQDRVPRLAADPLLRRSQKAAFAERGDLDAQEHVPGQPGEFRARIDQRFQGRGGQAFILRVPRYDADFE